jgi:hypothetical protein
MLPMLMMSKFKNNYPSRSRRSSGNSRINDNIKSRIKQISDRQQQLLSQLNSEMSGRYSNPSNDRVIRRINEMERRLERMRRNNLRKKQKPGMPKFLMFMQQNMMN